MDVNITFFAFGVQIFQNDLLEFFILFYFLFLVRSVSLYFIASRTSMLNKVQVKQENTNCCHKVPVLFVCSQHMMDSLSLLRNLSILYCLEPHLHW